MHPNRDMQHFSCGQTMMLLVFEILIGRYAGNWLLDEEQPRRAIRTPGASEVIDDRSGAEQLPVRAAVLDGRVERKWRHAFIGERSDVRPRSARRASHFGF